MMDGSDSNKKLCCGGVDRLSELPDEVIIVILSLLTTRVAATTSVLSSRLAELRKHTTHLNFNTRLTNYRSKIFGFEHALWDVNECKYVKMVNSVIQSHKALTLQKFSINFYVNKSAHSHITKWLQFALSKQVESLGLNFRYGFSDALHMVVLEECLRPQTPTLLKSLKRLYLDSLKVSGEDISLFLQNCPLLGELIISGSVLTSDVDVCGAVALKALDISFCFGGRSIRVSGPNLTSVHVDAGKGEKVMLENLPQVVKAGFRIKCVEFGVQRFASAVSSIISQLQTLTLVLSNTMELLANGFPEMPNLKELTVTDRGRYRRGNLLPVTALIWASPRLRLFRFKFFGKFFKVAKSKVEVERSPHQHLQHLEVKGFQQKCEGVGSVPMLKLMTYISNNCVGLQTLTLGNFDVKADANHLKQRLQTKIPHHIQLRFL